MLIEVAPVVLREPGRIDSPTGNKDIDDVAAAVAGIALIWLVWKIIIRVFYWAPRRSGNMDQVSYHAQARYLYIFGGAGHITSWLRRAASPGIPHRYSERNRYMVVCAKILAAIPFILEGVLIFGLTDIQVPIEVDIGSSFQLSLLSRRGVELSFNEQDVCQVRPLVGGQSVVSSGTISECFEVSFPRSSFDGNGTAFFVITQIGADLSDQPARGNALATTITVAGRGSATQITITGRLLTPEQESGLSLRGMLTANFTSQDLRDVIRQSLEENAEKTGLVFLDVPQEVEDVGGLIDMRRVKNRKGETVANKEAEYGATRSWIVSILQSHVLVTRGPGKLMVAGEGYEREVAKGQVVIGQENKTRIPKGIYLCAAAGSLSLLLVVVACFRSPVGLSWEVVEAHNRFCTDAVGTGPDQTLTVERSRSPDGTAHVGLSRREGYAQVDMFQEGEKV